jgi:hypothetical protein
MASQANNQQESQVEVELLQLPAASPWRWPRHDELFMLTLYANVHSTSTDYELQASYIGGGEPGPTTSPIRLMFVSEAEASEWIQLIYPGLFFMGRSRDDVPAIVGVWL